MDTLCYEERFVQPRKKGMKQTFWRLGILRQLSITRPVDNDNDVYVTMGKAQLIESDIDSQADQQQDV